jgi:primosomal replication protein N
LKESKGGIIFMAKLNAVMLSGFVFTVPREIPVDSTGNYYKAVSFDITIERKRLINGFDKLTVICYNDTAEKAKTLRKGDYIISDEVELRTTNYKRTIEYICPQCHHYEEKEINSEKTEIVVRDYAVIPRARPQSLLGVNRALMMGNACTPVDYFRYPSGRGQAQFKLAVDRTGMMKRLQHADYPFVLMYGQEADYVKENLEVGNLVMVDGYVSQREIKQKFPYICPDCGNGYEQTEDNKIVEVIAYRINLLKYVETSSVKEIEDKRKEDLENVKSYSEELKAKEDEDIFDFDLNEESGEKEVDDAISEIKQYKKDNPDDDDGMLKDDDDISKFLDSIF